MKKNKVFYIVFFAIILVLLANQWYSKHKISSCSKISISIITGGAGSFSTRRALLYSYKFKNKYFSGSDSDGIKDYKTFKDFNLYENKRYFVKFSCEDPSISELIWNIPVPDTLQYIPENGWDEIPYGLGDKK